MAAIPNSIAGDELIVTVTKITTISQHLLRAIDTVKAENHSTKQATRYELEFLKILHSQTSLPLKHAIEARRMQFLNDSLTADTATAIHFLQHNDTYSTLSHLERERALLSHQKAEATKDQKPVVAIIQQAPPSRGRTGGRGARGGGYGNSYRNNYHHNNNNNYGQHYGSYDYSANQNSDAQHHQQFQNNNNNNNQGQPSNRQPFSPPNLRSGGGGRGR
jgi:hypothetical protein